MVASVFAGGNEKVTVPIARRVRTTTSGIGHWLRNFPAPNYECYGLHETHLLKAHSATVDGGAN